MNAGWNIGINSKYNAGASLNYRNRNINIFSTYSFNGPNDQKINVQRTVLGSLFDQQGTIRQVGKAHKFKIGAHYCITKKNTIGIMVNGTVADPTLSTSNKTYISNTTTNNYRLK